MVLYQHSFIKTKDNRRATLMPDVILSLIITVSIIVIIVIVIIFLARMFSTECPKCKKCFATYEKSRKLISKKPISKDERKNIYNKKGEVTGYTYQKIHGTRYYYEYTKCCKYCGHTYTGETYEDNY